MNQIEFYQAKLDYETDSWDLFEGLKNGQNLLVVDARSPQAYETEHLPEAISFP